MTNAVRQYKTLSTTYQAQLLAFVFLILLATVPISCSSKTAQEPSKESAMSDSGHVHHTIDYIEFSVSDMAEAKRFYESAFLWKFNDYGPDYAGIQKDGGEAGGLRLTEEVSAGGPLVILYSNDLEKTLAMVRDAGGTITTEPFSFPGGRRFHFRDPSGNELAVYSDK
jgi:predicted enzyme related to lactoylglutathione lyase